MFSFPATHCGLEDMLDTENLTVGEERASFLLVAVSNSASVASYGLVNDWVGAVWCEVGVAGERAVRVGPEIVGVRGATGPGGCVWMKNQLDISQNCFCK